MKTRFIFSFLLGLCLLNSLSLSMAQPDKLSGTIRILTLNVWGLPGPLGTDRQPRMERIATSLENYDVVALQEMFDEETTLIIQRSNFPYSYRHNNLDRFRQGSGLAILSRYPILKTKFREFDACEFPDCLAHKGVLMARVLHPTLGPMDVYNTHYQSKRDEKSARVRQESDNKVMSNLVWEMGSYHPVVLAGDFNLRPDQVEYQDLMKRLPLLDTFAHLFPHAPGHTDDPVHNPYTPDSAKRIDYIFALNHPLYEIEIMESNLTHNQPIDGYMPSDHFGVYSKIKFTKKIAL